MNEKSFFYLGGFVMKKRFRIIAVDLAMGMMLQGCGSKKDNKENTGNTSNTCRI